MDRDSRPPKCCWKDQWCNSQDQDPLDRVRPWDRPTGAHAGGYVQCLGRTRRSLSESLLPPAYTRNQFSSWSLGSRNRSAQSSRRRLRTCGRTRRTHGVSGAVGAGGARRTKFHLLEISACSGSVGFSHPFRSAPPTLRSRVTFVTVVRSTLP